MAEKPAAAGIPADRDLAPHQLVQGRRRHIDRAHQHQMRGVDQPRRRLLVVLGLDHQRLAALAHPPRRRLDIDRQGQLAVDGERPRCGTMAEIIDLVGEANPDQRAARAFRAVFERRRNTAAGGDEAQPVHRGERLRAQRLVKAHAHPLAALAEIERAFGAAIAVVLKDQPLDAELDELGLPGARRHMRAPAALVVDRLDRTVLGLDQVELGDQPEPLGGQGHRARMDALVVANLLGLGQGSGAAVDAGDGRRAPRRCRPTPPIRPAPIRDKRAAGNTGTR